MSLAYILIYNTLTKGPKTAALVVTQIMEPDTSVPSLIPSVPPLLADTQFRWVIPFVLHAVDSCLYERSLLI